MGTLRTRRRQIVAYADDIAIATKQRNELREILGIITRERKMLLKINTEKPKLRRIGGQ